MQKLKDMIPGKKSAAGSSSSASSSTVPGKAAQPQILGRLKMGHRIIQLKKKIGQGGYATVYLAMDENTYKEYVLKRMDCKVGGVRWVIRSRRRRWRNLWIRSLRCCVSSVTIRM